MKREPFNKSFPSRTLGAYSIMEVLIAAAIVAVGIAAAALITNSSVQQQELAAISTRAVNLQEQAIRLARMGFNQSQITSILPGPFAGSADAATNSSYYLTHSVSSNTNTGVSIEVISSELVYQAGYTSDGSAVYRTNVITAVREQIR